MAQIPVAASTAAAILVTRVSKSRIWLTRSRVSCLVSRNLWVLPGCPVYHGVVPGIPHLSFPRHGCRCRGDGLDDVEEAAANRKLLKRKSSAPGKRKESGALEAGGQPAGLARDSGAAQQARVPATETKELGWDDVTRVDIVGLEVGYRLIPLVDKAQGGQLLARIKGVRKKLSQELGFLCPSVHIRDNLDLMPNYYRITLMGSRWPKRRFTRIVKWPLIRGRYLDDWKVLRGRDPAFGLEAVWIDPTLKEQAQTLGYTVVDASTVVATHLNQIMSKHAHELLGHEEVQQWLDQLSKHATKLAEELVPNTVSVGTLLKVLQNLLKEEVPIRDMRSIAEAIANMTPKSQDAGI